MSERYPGGIITKTPVTPTGPYQNGTAPGIWTLDQQLQFQQQGIWPTAGLVPNYIEDMFSTYLYTGTGASQPVTNGVNLSAYGGLVWIKQRDGGNQHILIDSARGISGSNIVANSASNGQPGNDTNGSGNVITSLDTSGFTLGTGSGYAASNVTSSTYASWTFRKQAKFFDVVTYTGTGSATTIAHNLGSVPGCIIVKKTSSTGQWCVYHNGLTSASYGIFLNLTDAQTNDSAIWNATNPTSTVFSVGTSSGTNASGATYVAYLFASNAGGFGSAGTDNVITCGSYTCVTYPGDVAVTLGYEPQWVMVKNATQSSNWVIYDNMRGMPATSPPNPVTLAPDSSAAENGVTGSAPGISPTATGFIARAGLTAVSGSAGDKVIYIAIRRGPMATPTTGTSVFSPNQTSGTTGTPITTNFPIDFQMLGINAGNVYNQRVSTRLTGVNTNGTSNSQYLVTSNTNAEAATGSLTLNWGSTGFQVPSLNSGSPTIFWNFQRAPGFFDVVCYTGNGTTGQTYNHNLSVSPELVITKSRSTTGNWWVSQYLTSPPEYSFLQDTNAFSSQGTDYPVTTTTFVPVSNISGTTFVSYLFATCAGVSKVGLYTGNGTTQTINCGFTGGARFVLIKRRDSTGNWYVYDTARGMTTLTDPYLLLNSTAAEAATLGSVTTVSTGFALNSSILAAINVNAGTYIFLAIS